MVLEIRSSYPRKQIEERKTTFLNQKMKTKETLSYMEHTRVIFNKIFYWLRGEN